MMKNHEGYTDTTAGRAIKRADRAKRRRTRPKVDRLTYRIGEVTGVLAILK